MYNRHLDTFLCAADMGSFSKAAEKLFISPNAVMKQVNLLEDHLGLQLFARNNHGLTLTPAGELIYREAKAVIRRSNKALAQAKALARQSDVIRVGTSLMRPGRGVVELWQQVNTQCPEIKIHLVSFDDQIENYTGIISRLGHDIDIVFGTFPSSRFNSLCSILRLGYFPLCCAVPMNHPLARRQRLTVRDLYGEQLMMVRRGSTSYIDALRDDLLQNHPQVEIVDVPDYDMDVIHRCETVGGVLLTTEIWKDVHPSLITLPVDWKFVVPYGLLYSKNPTKPVERFVEVVRDTAVSQS